MFNQSQGSDARILTVHGTAGVSAARVLADNLVNIRSEDVLVIVEHDMPAGEWLEREPLVR